VSERRFPAPWSAELTPNFFIVRDADGQQLFIMKASLGGVQRPSCSAKMRQDASPRTLLNFPTCCVGAEHGQMEYDAQNIAALFDGSDGRRLCRLHLWDGSTI
jgi:hypothetical protein